MAVAAAVAAGKRHDPESQHDQAQDAGSRHCAHGQVPHLLCFYVVDRVCSGVRAEEVHALCAVLPPLELYLDRCHELRALDITCDTMQMLCVGMCGNLESVVRVFVSRSLSLNSLTFCFA